MKHADSIPVPWHTFRTWIPKSGLVTTTFFVPQIEIVGEHTQCYLGRYLITPSTQHDLQAQKYQALRGYNHILWRQTSPMAYRYCGEGGGGGNEALLSAEPP
jgi:hypothetical protein